MYRRARYPVKIVEWVRLPSGPPVLLKQSNTNKQGNVGLGRAISYYTDLGFVVSLPLNDSQPYDLVIDDGKALNKVQVKTTRFKKDGVYKVLLESKSWTYRKKFDNTKCDTLFVLTEEGSIYEIPSKEITAKCELSLGGKVEEFRKGA